jgi:hypothetical protein
MSVIEAVTGTMNHTIGTSCERMHHLMSVTLFFNDPPKHVDDCCVVHISSFCYLVTQRRCFTWR